VEDAGEFNHRTERGDGLADFGKAGDAFLGEELAEGCGVVSGDDDVRLAEWDGGGYADDGGCRLGLWFGDVHLFIW
jgi:hypothetical protein